jgi:hypothetical protein
MCPWHLRLSIEKDTFRNEVGYLFIAHGLHDIEKILEGAFEGCRIKEGN